MKQKRIFLKLLWACALLSFFVFPNNAKAQTSTPPPTTVYCPATPTPTSPFPTLAFPTFQGFPTQPNYTSTPCPNGACPLATVCSWGMPCYQTATPFSTVVFGGTATVTTTATVTATAAPGALKLTAWAPSVYPGTGSYMLTQYKSAEVNGAAWNTFYGSAIMTGSTGNGSGSQLNFSMSFQNISSGSLTVYMKGQRTGVPGQGAINWRYPPFVTFPEMGVWRYGSSSIDTLQTTLGPGGTITLKPAIEADTGWISYSNHTLESYIVISTQPIDSVYTPVPATATATTIPCVPDPNGTGTTDIDTSIVGFKIGSVTPGSCYTLVPNITLEIPTIVSDASPYALESVGIPGFELCVSYWSMSLRLFDWDVFQMLVLAGTFVAAIVFYREFRS